jgi:O-antigen/teichoic acid export membrane protein
MRLAATLGSRFVLLMGGRVLLLLLALVATALLTRLLGPSGFGHYRAAVAYLALVISLADLGLASLFVREISRQGADQARVIANALGLRLVIAGSAMLLAVALAFALPFDHADRLGILAGAFGFLAYSVHLLLFGLFQQKLRQGGVVLAEVSGGVLLLALIGLFAWLGAAPWAFASALGLSYVFTLGVTLIAARRLVRFGIRLERDVCWRLAKAGAPLAVATSITVLYFRADTILLAILDTPAEVGLYGVPIKVVDSFMGITMLLVGLFAPLLANTARIDEGAFREHLENGLTTLAVGTTGVGVGIVALAPEIVTLLAGAEFAAAAPILQVLAGVLVLHGTALILRETATALAIQQRLLPSYVAGLIVAMAAYLVLIPPLGGVGAALALLIAETVVVVSIAVVVVRATGTGRALRAPVIALAAGLAAAAAVVWAEQQGWGFVLRAALGGGVYLCLLLGTGAVSLPVLWRLGRDMLGRKAG